MSNGAVRHRPTNNKDTIAPNGVTIKGKNDTVLVNGNHKTGPSSEMATLVICVGGIYASLSERITTTNYGTATNREVFKYPVVMNTVQSAFAAFLGYLYVAFTRKTSKDLPIFPSTRSFGALGLVAIVSALSSPFGYASLQHVDYITFILAKSCKLLPVMFLHVTLYRKKYPFYKYAVVALVTAGVAIFTLHQSAGSSKKKGAGGNSLYGLMLLGINLLFDGLTNSTQDDIYARFRPYTGKQMMPWRIRWYGSREKRRRAGGCACVHSAPSKRWLGRDCIFRLRSTRASLHLYVGSMITPFRCSSSTETDRIPSHDARAFRLLAAGHRDRDTQNANYDHLRCMVRSQPYWHAMAGRRSRVWRHRH
nr:udp-galactose transporter like 1 [Quercus suber]